MDIDTTKELKTWEKIIDFHKSHFPDVGWIFRGHSDSAWKLETTIERGFLKYYPILRDDHYSKVKDFKHQVIEKYLSRWFKRQCHLYHPTPHDDKNILELLALMQHFGAPTRLLDFTYSFFVALYFAMEDYSEDNGCDLWALNQNWLEKRTLSTLSENTKNILKDDHNIIKEETYTELFNCKSPEPFVVTINPYKMNERLVIQQGLFLIPSDISKTFIQNLKPLCSNKKETSKSILRIRIKVNPEERNNILRKLYRMNVSRASLFPGLEGFSASLKNIFIFPELLLGKRFGDSTPTIKTQR